jgi:CheY-like chemotaxis protein
MQPTGKILIVDDCLSTRTVIKEIVKPFNLDVLETSNGNDAISIIIKEKPDLIMLDIAMPFKDGLDVLEEMAEEMYDIPVVVISGDASTQNKENSLLLGAKEFVEKPIDPAMLRELIGKYLTKL